MRIYSFDKGTGKEITAYNSQNAIFSKIVKHDKPIHVGCIYVEPGGTVGAHQAPIHLGMAAIVIEGEDLNPSMNEVDWQGE
ncbi:hypothetical protein [Cohnella thailandensis]|uniref:Cupin domain-containing protein n=1 Tax=Cohnella thailandensis TaxID=557557 RepID=A0A841SXC8_9BACL|nr:hypothetical protein [Cohnella thailandensis]MBB6635286.1 hypothetical protein [Cohnella thailandensis]MBP1974663.1 hypothetical protein [Cohnella thailandensis]